jgi:hypothetical protein
VLMTPPFAIPATATIAQAVVFLNGGGNYRFHRAAVRTVSSLGVEATAHISRLCVDT